MSSSLGLEDNFRIDVMQEKREFIPRKEKK
jgi:hypothetical protein